MSRGHGTMGLLDRLRKFADLAGAGSEVSRRAFLEIRLGLALTGWAASGSNFTRTVTAAELTKLGEIRPIVAASSMIHPRQLTRVEQVSDLAAGTWFYDDAALVAGGSTTLYVRLPTATDPDDAGLVVQLLFCFGGGDVNGNAEVYPLLGANKFLNPGLEAWSGGNPTSWTEVGAGAAQETTVVLDGFSSARIGSASIGADALDGIEQSRTVIQGAQYRVDSYFQTPALGQSADVEARLRVGVMASWLNSDGLTLTATDGGFRIPDTNGETQPLAFDFTWPAPTASVSAGIFLKNTAGGARAGLLYVDRMNFRRIHRWNLFANLMAGSSIPDLTIQSQSILFGPKTIGFGSVTLIDGDGELAKALASLLVLQKPCQVYVGGSFKNGDEVHRGDWRGQFSGLIRKPDVSPGQIVLELEDAKALTLGKAPENAHLRTLPAGPTPDLARMDDGLPKPLVFGSPYNDDGTALRHIIPGVRVALTANGYGEYRCADETIPVRDGVDMDMTDGPSLKVYPNRELADLDLQGYLITDAVNDFVLAENKTLWRILRDIRNMRYDSSGNNVGDARGKASFTFEYIGVVYTVSLSVSGPPYKVCADLQALMRAAAGGVTNITVTYDEGGGANPHKVSVAKTSGAGAETFKLLFDITTPGIKVQVPGWGLFGFDLRTDRTGTGAVTFVADDPIFTDADADHIIRFAGGGYRDDAAGSICGVANAAIDSWPAIASWLLQKRYNVPASEVNVAEFKAARDISRSTDFAIVFGTFSEGQGDELLAIAEQVSVASIVPDGEGIWRCIKHAAGTAGAREFFDEDYIAGSWRMGLDPLAVHKAVKVHGDWSPSLKRFMTHGDGIGVTDPFIPLKHGAESILEINSYIERQYLVGGTSLIATYYGRLIGKAPRVVSFEATSKLVDLLPGHKVILSKSGPGVYDPSGALSAVPFRIVDLTQRYSTTGISRCVAVEDVTFLS